MKKLGLSGDTILVKDNLVIKICETNQTRFVKNVNKQKLFNNSFVRAIPILEHSYVNGKNYIVMPFLKCANSIEWLSEADTNSTLQLSHKLKEYFRSIIQNGHTEKFDYLTWNNKLSALRVEIKDPELQAILDYLGDIKFDKDFYYGDYHGDFTFSNMLLSKHEDNVEVDVIDFLDSFIESPIHDLVKIRQDTKHLWTLKLFNGCNTIDRVKIVMFLHFIDKMVADLIDQDEILSEYYLPFQILNLLRIIPYNKNENIFQYLKGEIVELFEMMKGKDK